MDISDPHPTILKAGTIGLATQLMTEVLLRIDMLVYIIIMTGHIDEKNFNNNFWHLPKGRHLKFLKGN